MALRIASPALASAPAIPGRIDIPFAVLIVVWGALKNHRWTVPIAAMLALPALWYGGLAIIIATWPLVGAKSWADLKRALIDGWHEMTSWASTLRLPGRRPGESAPPVD